MDIKILYEDKDVLVVDKPAGIVVFPEGQTQSGTLIEALIDQKPELAAVGEPQRYGVVHRLDKDTSGVLLVAKSTEGLIFLQKQFKSRGVEKKYICLVEGAIKDNSGVITTLLGRSTQDPRKQTVWRSQEAAPASAREAISEYTVIGRYESLTSLKLRGMPSSGFTLLEVKIKTGRKHQIRAQMAWLQHPIVGDKLYAFKNSPTLEGLSRQFLHAAYIKIQCPDGIERVFESPLPQELQNVLDNLT